MAGKGTAGTAAMEADVSQSGAGAVLDALDPEQRAVALAVRGPVCVLAGAGTGKTRAITHRIAYAALTGVADPARVLALTFTVRAAGELRGRLRLLSGAGLGTEAVRATTFHAAALRQLTYFWPRVVGGRPPRLIESKLPLLGDAARVLRLRTEGGGLSDIAAEIEWAKVTQVRPDGYVAAAAKAGRAPGPVGADGVASLYDTYERLRRERQLIDFESVLELTAAILADSRPAADQVRASFRYFVVDEYQDVNPLQKLLLDVWLGDRDDLCVVGDPHQMIYSFTGATHRYLTGFAAEFPDATVVRLVRDYRSTPQVVALANRLVSPPAVAATAGVPATGPARCAGPRRPPGGPAAGRPGARATRLRRRAGGGRARRGPRAVAHRGRSPGPGNRRAGSHQRHAGAVRERAGCRRGELRHALLDLRGGGIHQHASVGEHESGDGLITSVDAHHVVGSGRVALDVDLGHGNSVPGQLAFQTPAESAPLGRVHGQLSRHVLSPSIACPV